FSAGIDRDADLLGYRNARPQQGSFMTNDTRAAVSRATPPCNRTLGGVLREIAERTPNQPAILYRGEKNSYAELYAAAVRVAEAMLALGVRRGDRVGVLLGNRPEWLVMCFGATLIGAIFTPLNTWYKQAELAWAIRHGGLRVLVSASQ